MGWVRKSHQEKGGRRACLRTGCFMGSLWRRRPGAGSRGPRWVRPWFLVLWGCLQFCVLGASVFSLIFSGAPLLLPTLLCAGLGLLYCLCRDVRFRHVHWFGLCSTVIVAGVTRGRISRGEGFNSCGAVGGQAPGRLPEFKVDQDPAGAGIPKSKVDQDPGEVGPEPQMRREKKSKVKNMTAAINSQVPKPT